MDDIRPEAHWLRLLLLLLKSRCGLFQLVELLDCVLRSKLFQLERLGQVHLLHLLLHSLLLLSKLNLLTLLLLLLLPLTLHFHHIILTSLLFGQHHRPLKTHRLKLIRSLINHFLFLINIFLQIHLSMNLFLMILVGHRR